MSSYVQNASQQIRLTSAAPIYSRHNQELPLNLILLILSHLDDISDISRVTRTSRLLFYLTLPRLYEHVTLRSYSSIRYVDGTPQGFGGGSPFCTGLDSLVSSSANVAGYVKSLHLLGDWREADTDDFSKGRIPDSTMILNVAIKAAIERMQRLETFRWELTTKPMKTVYQGLAQRSSLTCLKIRLASSRIPRPTISVPPIPTLKTFHLINIDPLCYPDDFSTLLLHARGLEDLGLSWSPRMRTEREPSISLHAYFGRLASSKHTLKLKHVAFVNLYTQKDPDLDRAVVSTQLETITFINCVNADDPTTVFMDSTWMKTTTEFGKMKKFRKMRTDGLDSRWAKNMASFEGLQEIYLVNNPNWWPESPPPESSPSSIHPNGASLAVTTTSQTSSNTNGDISSKASSPSNDTGSRATGRVATPYKPSVSLASDYIAAITKHHGPTLTKLLLNAAWTLDSLVVKHIAAECPKLEQLGLAFESYSVDVMRALVTALPKLTALRILMPPEMEMWRQMRGIDQRLHEETVAREMWRDEYRGLRWVGFGGFVVRLGGVTQRTDGNGWRRVTTSVSWDDAKHIEIFGMDSAEI